MIPHGYLAHHGVKGQKWGVRRYQNYDGTRIKDPRYSDISLKKGHKFYRVYTYTGNKFDPNSYQSKRAYVSDNPHDYLNSGFIYDPNNTYVVELEAKKKVIFAGEEAVNKILKEIGEKPLEPAETYFHGPHDGTDRDFLMKNAEIGEKFIKRAIQKGYSGVRDPYDDMTIGYSKTAKILFDLDQDFKVNNAKKVRFK